MTSELSCPTNIDHSAVLALHAYTRAHTRLRSGIASLIGTRIPSPTENARVGWVSMTNRPPTDSEQATSPSQPSLFRAIVSCEEGERWFLSWSFLPVHARTRT